MGKFDVLVKVVDLGDASTIISLIKVELFKIHLFHLQNHVQHLGVTP